MIRQAHTYLVGAMSAATLIAIAIAAFVVLVSAQVFTDWPIAALGGDDRAAVSDARPLGDGDVDRAGAGGAAIAAGTVAPRADRAGAASDGGPDGAAIGNGTRSRDTAAETGNSVGSTGSGEAPVADEGDESPGTSAGGGGGSSQPASPAPAAQSSPASSSGGAAGGGSAGGGAAGGSTGGGGSAGGGSTGGSSEPSTSGAVSETVNGTVGAVDEKVLGGALGSTGVTGVTEGVVEGVAGPESPVGKVVDETVKAVGGLLGGGR